MGTFMPSVRPVFVLFVLTGASTVHTDKSNEEWVRDEYLSAPHSHFRDRHHPDYDRHYEYVSQ